MQRPGSKMQPLEAEDTKLRLRPLKPLHWVAKNRIGQGAAPGGGTPGQSPLCSHFVRSARFRSVNDNSSLRQPKGMPASVIIGTTYE